MEPLSKPLTDWLLKLKLCTRADLRRCRGRVRRLARDLPAFDSVWIDALVHARRITAFQARLLESGHPEQLAVGPCVLIDQLGRGMSATYLARDREGRQRCVLKRIPLDEEQRGPALAALQELVGRSKPLSHPGVVTPKSCLAHQQDLVTVSRYLAGPTLNQLLVRRGRFPARIVFAIAKQMIGGLAALEECELVHGDLQLKNLRLSASGRVVMVDAGVAPAIRPVLNIHARYPLEHYDGVAPELISTGNRADVRSEFYALGCLLWQLLAGRPPYPTGDPLAKLMAHQTRRIPDVRDIAPDTPKELADILQVFTDPEPDRRPPSFRAFRDRWGRPRRRHRRQIARFRAAFNTAIPHVPAMRPEAESNRWPAVAALTFLLSGASLFLMDEGASSRLLSIPNRLEEYLNAGNSTNPTEEDDVKHTGPSQEPPGQPLPTPDADGVIELSDSGPYRAGQIEIVGPLTIRGTADSPAEILVGQSPFGISSADVVLENLSFRPQRSMKADVHESQPRPLVRVATRSLTARNCRWELASESDEGDNAHSTVGLDWQPIDPSHPANSRVTLENCHADGAGTACRFKNWPSQIVIKNCLKTGAGWLLDFSAAGHTRRNLQLQITRLTLRQASGLLRCDLGSNAQPGSWLIQADDCVFDLNQNPKAIFQVQGPSAPRFLEDLQMQGRQSLLKTTATVANWRRTPADAFLPADDSAMNVQGLVLAGLKFAGSPTGRPEDSALESWEGPRFSSRIPGIEPGKLPLSPPANDAPPNPETPPFD